MTRFDSFDDDTPIPDDWPFDAEGVLEYESNDRRLIAEGVLTR